jgi:hypothetical protein
MSARRGWRTFATIGLACVLWLGLAATGEAHWQPFSAAASSLSAWETGGLPFAIAAGDLNVDLAVRWRIARASRAPTPDSGDTHPGAVRQHPRQVRLPANVGFSWRWSPAADPQHGGLGTQARSGAQILGKRPQFANIATMIARVSKP